MSDPIFFLPSITPPKQFNLGDVGDYAKPVFADIDGDGDLDAFVGEYNGNTLFYNNYGDVNSPQFTAPETNPFGLTKVGLHSWGAYASPTLVDIDGDGDLDMFIGSGGYYNDGEKFFFKNVGTATSPLFSTPVINPFGLNTLSSYRSSPIFVDIDGDGDQDAFVGESDGNTYFFRNTGTAHNPVFSAATSNPFGLSSVGSFSSPAFADIDVDGDLDALIGNEAGNTLFFRNTGTSHNPTFGAVSINPFGLINVGNNANPTLADIDGDGDLDAFLGEGEGNTIFFANNGLLLKSSLSDDILNGTGSLNDTVTYVSATTGVTVSLLKTLLQNTIGAGFDTLTSIENLTGSKFNDNLTGGTGNNVLDAKAGNDILRGWSGADTMIGGLGNDTYFVENGGDIVTEILNQGTDSVSTNLSYTLPANVENLTLTGASVINGTGNAQANIIIGNAAVNQLSGNAGNDKLDGKTGNNVLTGGAGNDIFKFTTKGHIDTITDYNVANDTIQLENGVFTALTTPGILAAGQFRVGSKALDANDFITYNKTAGTLFYDSDGNGAVAATQIATIGSGLNLTNADIVVI